MPVSWRRIVPAIEADALAMPRYLRKARGEWQALRFGAWEPLNLDAAAVHLGWDEAMAWCRWTVRRMPTEAEWEYAAHVATGFAWGEVWEWTSSRFAPFDGFMSRPNATTCTWGSGAAFCDAQPCRPRQSRQAASASAA